MNNKIYIIVNLWKGLLAAVISAFCIFFSVFFFNTARPLEGTVFLIIGMIFLPVLFIYCSHLKIDKNGVYVYFLFIKRSFKSWESIAEVGVIGERVVKRNRENKVGTLYFYFSEKEMDDKERYQLGMKWPPLKMPFAVFSLEKAEQIQLFWSKKMALYNVGKLDF